MDLEGAESEIPGELNDVDEPVLGQLTVSKNDSLPLPYLNLRHLN
jgi:hypothetical protein